MYSNPRYLEDGAFQVSLPRSPFGHLLISCFVDDILSDIATDPDDLLGLDHVNKNRGFWNRSESFFIK